MIKKITFVALGFIFFSMGAIGAFLPVLPTVPFLLAAAFFFARGSERFNQWFLSTKLYKKHLESFTKSRSMTLKTKIGILGFASTMLILGFIFSPSTIARIVIAFAFVFKYYYFIFKIKTVKSNFNIP